MANKDFELQQLLRAYRKGIISDELLSAQMAELRASENGRAVVNGSARPEKVYDRAAEDLGNIVALEHVNVTVPNQELATRFYIDALGLTRDPYMMTGPANMWVNVGRSQFHLPTSKPQLLRGHIGVVVSNRAALLKRLTRARKHLEGTRFDFRELDGCIEATCPWGNRIRCFEPDERFGRISLGIPYVEFDVPPNSADGIARFYKQIMGAQAAPLEDKQGRFACVTVGNAQNLFFRETDRSLPAYDNHHIQIYIADFSDPYNKLKDKGLISQESDQHQYRFQDIIDPDSGKTLFTIEHEVRSLKHPLYMRPLVNRNPEQNIMSYSPGYDAWNWAMAPAN
ncbi:MAG: VOC family protein [Candidatus Binataceae bacterium]